MLKYLIRIVGGFLLFVLLLIALAYATGYGYLIRGVRVTYFTGHKTAFLSDYRYFDNSTVARGTPQPWPLSEQYNLFPPSGRLESLHQTNGTVAFLIIKNDSIFYERYYDKHNEISHTNSFSMAKSIVTSALGKAVSLGYLTMDTKVGDYFSEYATGDAALVTVADLASMASGIKWDEKYYSPFSDVTRLYFDRDITAFLRVQKVVDVPGKTFNYSSGDTQLLAMVLEEALPVSLPEFVSEHFWKPMGAETEALWQMDRADGMVKAYCCFASNARDFARFAKLYKDHGHWNGVQILDSTFVATSTRPRFSASPQYGYGWWLDTFQEKEMFYMRGHLGQYAIVVPQDNVVIIRLGHRGNVNGEGKFHGTDFYVYLEEAYKMLEER